MCLKLYFNERLIRNIFYRKTPFCSVIFLPSTFSKENGFLCIVLLGKLVFCLRQLCISKFNINFHKLKYFKQIFYFNLPKKKKILLCFGISSISITIYIESDIWCENTIKTNIIMYINKLHVNVTDIQKLTYRICMRADGIYVN